MDLYLSSPGDSKYEYYKSISSTKLSVKTKCKVKIGNEIMKKLKKENNASLHQWVIGWWGI